jgi:putative transposase
MSLAVTLPREYPPWKTVYHYFRQWRINGTFEKLNAVLRERLRICLGRNPQPSAGIADSHSAKRLLEWVENSEATTVARRFTAGKGTYWWTPRDWSSAPRYTQRAKIPEQDGLKMLLESARAGVSHLKHLWLDAGYEGRGKRWAERRSWA